MNTELYRFYGIFRFNKGVDNSEEITMGFEDNFLKKFLGLLTGGGEAGTI